MHLASCIRSLLLALVPLVPARLACAQSLPPPALPTNEAQWKMEKSFALEGLRPVKVERTLIYQPSTEWAYSHHQSITFFKGRFHAIWSNGRKDEDAPGQRVLTASSADFLH
jgi:hypothetical protein